MWRSETEHRLHYTSKLRTKIESHTSKYVTNWLWNILLVKVTLEEQQTRLTGSNMHNDTKTSQALQLSLLNQYLNFHFCCMLFINFAQVTSIGMYWKSTTREQSKFETYSTALVRTSELHSGFDAASRSLREIVGNQKLVSRSAAHPTIVLKCGCFVNKQRKRTQLCQRSQKPFRPAAEQHCNFCSSTQLQWTLKLLLCYQLVNWQHVHYKFLFRRAFCI